MDSYMDAYRHFGMPHLILYFLFALSCPSIEDELEADETEVLALH